MMMTNIEHLVLDTFKNFTHINYLILKIKTLRGTSQIQICPSLAIGAGFEPKWSNLKSMILTTLLLLTL